MPTLLQAGQFAKPFYAKQVKFDLFAVQCSCSTAIPAIKAE